MRVIKKDCSLEEYNEQKIINAVSKAALRAREQLTDNDYSLICNRVLEHLAEEDTWNEELQEDLITVFDMHSIVENVLMELFPNTGTSYIEYRNYKVDFVKMMDEVYMKEQEQRYVGDVSNANTDSTMVSTQRSLSYGLLSRALYRKFFLNSEEREATRDGYIYVHDDKDRRDTMNCCLFDVSNVLTGGFEMGNIWYNEPNSLDTSFDVISDITLSAASQQYGGFTLPEIDKILDPYSMTTNA